MNYKVVERETLNKKTQGLPSRVAEQNYNEFGKNEIILEKPKSKMKIFLEQFKNIFIIILFMATIISLFMGQELEAMSILVVIIINSVFGFLEELKTEKTLTMLKDFSTLTSKVIRDGEVKVIDTRLVTIDDVVLLESGDKIPADGIIIHSNNLQVDESMLTGEALPVNKSVTNKNDELDKKNIVFAGTTVLKGKAKVIIKRIGMETEIGQIAEGIQSIKKEHSPLELKLMELSKNLGIICIFLCFLVFIIGTLRGENILDMVILGISLAVAAIPEGLPAVITITLSLSIRRLIKRNVLIKKLNCAETLGAVKVICTDKTGTITQNKMTVKGIHTPTMNVTVTGEGYFSKGDFLINGIKQNLKDLVDIQKLLYISVLCNDATIMNNTLKTNRDRSNNNIDFLWETTGDPTEIALLIMASKVGVLKSDIENKTTLIDEIPFDSERKMMSVVHTNGNTKIVSTKGAIEYLLKKSNFMLENGQIVPLKEDKKLQILKNANEKAENGFRVLGFSFKETNNKNYEEQLVYVGFVTIVDPPKENVKKAVSTCFKANIKPVMVTGDNLLTAKYIAKEVGIYNEGDMVVTGDELLNMSDEYLKANIDKISIFSRVKPKDKLRIVKAFKSKGKIVAMTGDGVNDSLSIKEANIGVSMGISGTDITKEVSDIIITDDDFSSIVSAVSEGRTIYSNIRKFIRYLLATNIGEICTMVIALMMGMPIVLLPIQILVINLVTDTLPAISLGLEPPSDNLMLKKPRKPNESIFSNGLFAKILSRGVIIGLSSLGAFVTNFNIFNDLELARTCAFFTLVICQLVYVFECKSEEKTIFEINFLNNKKLIGSVIISLIIMLAIIYIPVLNVIFTVQPLSVINILICTMFVIIGPIISYILLI